MNPKCLNFLVIISFFLFHGFLSAAEHANLIGKWQGNWDGFWPAEFNISKNSINKKPDSKNKSDKDYQVKYRWKEHPNGSYSKFKHIGKIVNENTLHAGKMYLVIDIKDKNKAIVFGVFDGRTRIAYLNRVVKESVFKPKTNLK